MSLYKYTGEPGRVWPAVPVTADPGDVVNWGDVVPDPLCWDLVKTAKTVRPADNADASAPDVPDAPAPDPTTTVSE